MTTTAPTAALSCPDCRAPLTGVPTCAACALPLTGPHAVRLWQVDVALARLDAARSSLGAERVSLLAALRSGAPAAAGQPPTTPVAAPRQEWTPRRVQNLLLGLGGLLLAVAATVFTAVTYDRLGAGGRAAILLALTALAAGAAPKLRARGLEATAETVASVTLALAALDAFGLRRLGVGADLRDLTWYAGTAGALAALAAAYAAATRLRVARVSAVALGNAALLLAIVALEPSATSACLLLLVVTALDLAAVAVLAPRERSAAVTDLLASAVAAVSAVGGLALVVAIVAVGADGRDAALALVGCAAVAAAAAVVAGPTGARTPLAGLPVLLVAGAALVQGGDALDAATQPLVAAAVALAVLPVVALLPARDRSGPALAALLVAGAATAAVLEHVVTGLLGPVGWLAEPWSLPAGTDAAAAVRPGLAEWDGTPSVLAVLVLAGCVATGAAFVLDRARVGIAAGAAAALVTALLVPVALDVPHPVALLLLLALAAALVAGADGLRVGRPVEALAALGTAGVAGALGATWSLADQGTTLAVLPAVAGLVGVVAVRPGAAAVQAGATAVAALLGAGEVAAAAAAQSLSPEQIGGCLLGAAAVGVTGSRMLDGGRRVALELAAATVAGTAVVLATADPGWLSWTLAGAGLLALAASLAAGRRMLAPVGALLLTASSWVRLAEAGVDAPEPYTLPLAALALLLGHLRFGRDAHVRSQGAYGPGLALLLLPSLAAALADGGLARPLTLGAVALAVVLVGAHVRLQAPLLFGGATLAVVALDLLAPYASAIPRWTALGAVGTLLVVVGATFEQRRREVAVLRDRYAALR
jgi:hypothetical protein